MFSGLPLLMSRKFFLDIEIFFYIVFSTSKYTKRTNSFWSTAQIRVFRIFRCWKFQCWKGPPKFPAGSPLKSPGSSVGLYYFNTKYFRLHICNLDISFRCLADLCDFWGHLYGILDIPFLRCEEGHFAGYCTDENNLLPLQYKWFKTYCLTKKLKSHD